MDNNDIPNVVMNMNQPYVEPLDDLEGHDSRFGGELPDMGPGQIKVNIDESNVLGYYPYIKDLCNSRVAHHGVDIDDYHTICEETDQVDFTLHNHESGSKPSQNSNPPPHESSPSLALEPLPTIIPPCHVLLEFKPLVNNLEPWEPNECTEINSTNLNLCLVPHLSREEHFTEPPWHIEERERKTFGLQSVADPISSNTTGPTYDDVIISIPPSGWIYDATFVNPPSGWINFMDYHLLNFKKWKK